MKILGISEFYHDLAIAITDNVGIVPATQEERFTRKKHTVDFSNNTSELCLEQTVLDIDELKQIDFVCKENDL